MISKPAALCLPRNAELWRRSSDDEVKRLCIIYAIIGYYRLERYENALKYADELFKVRPRDRDGKRLVELVKQSQRREVAQAAMIAGGGAVAAGLLAAAVFGLSRLFRR